MRNLLLLFIGLAAAGCGTSFCDADLADIAGSYVFEVEADGDTTRIDITIHDDGSVDADVPGEDAALTCDILQSELCDLEVECSDADGDTLRFTLHKDAQ